LCTGRCRRINRCHSVMTIELSSDIASTEVQGASAVYLDNAATSWPKAPGVVEAMHQYLEAGGGNPGRGGHSGARRAAVVVEDVRRRAAQLISADRPEHVVFTHNATHGLNLVLKGYLRPGDHVVTTCSEHTSVLRPLEALRREGRVRYDAVATSGTPVEA